MIDKDELINLVDKVSASNNAGLIVVYEYLSESEKKNIRIKNGEEVWYGVKVIRMKL